MSPLTSTMAGFSSGSGTINSNGQASITLNSLPVGTDSFSAGYAGDADLSASNINLSYIVNPATTSLALAASPSNG